MYWDALFNRDKKGILKKRMMELCDGEYQTFKAKNGAYVRARQNFFNTPGTQGIYRRLDGRRRLATELRRPRISDRRTTARVKHKAS